MAKITLIYRRSNGGFRKGFNHTINGVSVAISTIPLVNKFTWHFKALDGSKKSIDWTGAGDIDGDPLANFYFDVPKNFFNIVTNYDCDIEAYDNGGNLIYHTEESFLVKVTEPAGVHSET